jgi:hypothetical protein
MAERFVSIGSRTRRSGLNLEELEDRRVLSGGLLSGLPLLAPPTSTYPVSAQTSTISQPTTGAPTPSSSTSTTNSPSLLNVGLNLGLNLGASSPTSTGLGLDLQANVNLGLGTSSSPTSTGTSGGLGLLLDASANLGLMTPTAPASSTPSSGLSLSLGANLGLGTTSSSTGTPSLLNLGLSANLGNPSTSSSSTPGTTLDLGIPSLLDVSVGLGTNPTTSAPQNPAPAGINLGVGATPDLNLIGAATGPLLSVSGSLTASPASNPILIPTGVTSPVVTADPVAASALATRPEALVLPPTMSGTNAPLSTPASTFAVGGNGLTATAVQADGEGLLATSQALLFDGETTALPQAAPYHDGAFVLAQPFLNAPKHTLLGGAAAPEGIGAVKVVPPANPGGGEEVTDETPPAEALLDGEGSGLVTDFQPANSVALDQAFSNLVEQLDLLGSEVAQALRRNPWTSWGLGCVAAAVVCEILHQRRRRRRHVTGDLTLDDDSTSSIHWLPGLSDPSGT